MVESGCKALIGQREKGPGMRWSVAGAQAVANVRVLVFNNDVERLLPDRLTLPIPARTPSTSNCSHFRG